MNIEKLLSEINMTKTYIPKIMDAYNEWINNVNASDDKARELLTDEDTFKEPEKTIMLLLYIALEKRDHGT